MEIQYLKQFKANIEDKIKKYLNRIKKQMNLIKRQKNKIKKKSNKIKKLMNWKLKLKLQKKKIKKEYKENLKKEIINELKFEKEEKIKSFVCPIIYRQDPNNYKKFIISNDNKEILKQLNFLISPSKSLKFELLFNSNEYEYLDNHEVNIQKISIIIVMENVQQ